jgi:hypothetical protein
MKGRVLAQIAKSSCHFSSHHDPYHISFIIHCFSGPEHREHHLVALINRFNLAKSLKNNFFPLVKRMA